MNKLNRVVIENIRLPYTASDDEAIKEGEKIIRRAGISPSHARLYLHKKSLDARRAEPSAVISLYAEIDGEIPEGINRYGIRPAPFTPLEFKRGSEILPARPVIAGFGPAGIFCALALAEAGLRPIVIEKGAAVEERTKIVEQFMGGGEFDKNTNIQFGAGGAGTFSDGKLTTRISDPRCAFVTEELISLGAPEAIRYQAKPHIGTDVLRNIVSAAHAKICSLGGEIRYNSPLTGICENRVKTDSGDIPYGVLVLATGHSAHDVYNMLMKGGIILEAKPFSVGVRIEHLQEDINRGLYGRFAEREYLPKGEYCLSHTKGKRGVYTFCMCPGGVVVPASADEEGVISNGMSYAARDGVNANSAVAATVNPADYGSDPRKAISFQKNIEHIAFIHGGRNYNAPIQTVGGFYGGKITDIPTRVSPTYRSGRVTPADLNLVLPSFVTDALKEGLTVFGKRIRGFDASDVPLTGVETRTSSPVRITRNESLTLDRHSNIYPCGEGAGYAGGIMSAAVDGLRVAEAILAKYAK